MPELPEVEITRRGLLPLVGQTVKAVVIRQASMRWPIPLHLHDTLCDQKLVALTRRAKYILATFQNAAGEIGTLLLHLGMSGRLSLLTDGQPAQKHDHFDIVFQNNHVLRLRDPRRFGAVLWAGQQAESHPLLHALGPEPLAPAFNADYLYTQTRSRSASIKTTIMDAHLVVGVGNIYASESLFHARINPHLSAKSLSHAQCARLVTTIQTTLQQALAAGGSSLRDFFGADGNPGYFQQTYFVYGRTGAPCRVCATAVINAKIGQRSSFFCPSCQKS